MKKLCYLLGILMVCQGTVFAAGNEELLVDLNKSITFLTKTRKQYETHRKQFTAEMPYMEVIPGRKNDIAELRKLVKKLGGETEPVNEEQLIIDEAEDIFMALPLDASLEITVFRICNRILHRYDNPEVRKVISRIRDQSLAYYMYFDNISQMSTISMLRGREKYMMFDPQTHSEPPPEGQMQE